MFHRKSKTTAAEYKHRRMSRLPISWTILPNTRETQYKRKRLISAEISMSVVRIAIYSKKVLG